MDDDACRSAAQDDLARLRAEVDARTAELAAHHAARLSCRRGCAGCCLDDLTVFEVEAEAIRRAFPELLARETPHAAGACAFLDVAGACRIYEQRPYLCRTHGLPLALVEERGDEFVELRDVCPLNERGAPLEELAPEELWRIGPFEERLRAVQARFSGGPLRRVPLRSLFARAHVLEPALRRPLSEALAEIEKGGHWSSVLRELFRRESWMNEGARAALVPALARLLHFERRAAAALERQLPRKSENESVFALHLASLVLAGSIDAARAAHELPGLDWVRFVERDAALRADPDPARAFAQRASLPLFLAKRLLEEFGAQADELSRSWKEPPRIALRANTLLVSAAELRARLLARGVLARPGRFAPDALVLDGHANVFEWPEFHAGLFEPQDESSQLAARLVAPPARARVVDACAGSGGKTLALSAMLSNKGRVLALDRNTRRLAELERRAARAQAFNVLAARTPGEGEQLSPELERMRGRAQRVLVDAPCSGLGALRRKPDLLRRLEARTLAELPHEQLAIARGARRWLAPGGRLVYATCTLLAAENERVVEALIADGMQLVPAREVLGGALADQVCSADGRYLKLLPHVHGTDGFFAAVLREPKTASVPASGAADEPAG